MILFGVYKFGCVTNLFDDFASLYLVVVDCKLENSNICVENQNWLQVLTKLGITSIWLIKCVHAKNIQVDITSIQLSGSSLALFDNFLNGYT